jgi:hypothetical protein
MDGFINAVSLQTVSNSQINFSNGIMPVSVVNLPAPLPSLQANTLYVNDGIDSIQTAVDSSSQADTIIISSGSFDESLTISNKYNIAITNLGSNGGTICEILEGLYIIDTAELLRFSNITFKGANADIGGTGRHRFTNCGFTGTLETPINITIGEGTTLFMTFLNCEFNEYTNIIIHPTLANVIYFINCNFALASITCSQFSPQQVIFNNCSGLDNLTGSNYTKVGLTVSGTDINQNQTNSYIASSLNFASNSKIYLDGNDGDVGKVIVSNGASGLTWAPAGGYDAVRNVFYLNNQQTVKSASAINLFSKVNQANIIPDLRCLLQCIFNFTISNNNPTLTFTLVNDDTSTVLQTITQSMTRNGHHNIAINFDFIMPSVYTLSFSVNVTTSNGTVSTDVNDFYSIIFNQLQNSA